MATSLVTTLVLVLSAAAHATPGSTETDRPITGQATYTVGTATYRFEGTRLLHGQGSVLAERVLSPPVARADVLCASDEGADGLGRLRCWNDRAQVVTLAVGGRPSRLALGPTHLAWVASPAGLPQVFVAPLDGTAPARALTNAAAVKAHTPGHAPEGFVAPPLRDSLRFDGVLLRWDAQDGAHEVRWR
jgi:hypothetical protein